MQQESVTSPRTKGLTRWVHERVPEDTDLDRPSLARLVVELGSAPRFWKRFVRHDPKTRHFVQLYRDPHLDLWLICWLDAQDTGYHDHDISSGAVYVCEGTLHEDHFERDAEGWIMEKTRQHDAGSVFDFDVHSRSATRGRAAGDLAPCVLARPLAHGALRARPEDGRARPHLHHLRGRARLGGIAATRRRQAPR